MSSLFSDPPFRRGTTLLQSEDIELNKDTGLPVAGGEIVGQVKVFQDVNPSTGTRLSNRLVYCVAARYTGTTVSDATTVAGEVFLCDFNTPLSAFTVKGTASNVLVGLAYGVLDEYLTGELRKNDIVWLVVKGPADVKQTNVAIVAGAQVQVSATAGQIATLSGGLCIGQQIEGANSSAAVQLTRVNLIGYEVG
jgi:hypothetical protein